MGDIYCSIHRRAYAPSNSCPDCDEALAKVRELQSCEHWGAQALRRARLAEDALVVAAKKVRENAEVFHRIVKGYADRAVAAEGAAIAFNAQMIARMKERDAALAQLSEATELLAELADLMEDTITRDYTPDSFTAQPARTFLAANPPAKGE